MNSLEMLKATDEALTLLAESEINLEAFDAGDGERSHGKTGEAPKGRGGARRR